MRRFSTLLMLLFFSVVTGCQDAVTNPSGPNIKSPKFNTMTCYPNTATDDWGNPCNPANNVECDDAMAYTLWYCATYLPQQPIITIPGPDDPPTPTQPPSSPPPPPAPDSVSYEQVAAVTDQMMRDLDKHAQLWSSSPPPIGLMAAPQLAASQSAQPQYVNVETAIDLVTVGYDIGQLWIAGNSERRMQVLLTDIGFMFIPGAPAPGSVHVLTQGDKLVRELFNSLGKVQVSIAIGQAYHADRSDRMWRRGDIGASKLVNASTGDEYFIDGAYINRSLKMIDFVDYKPDNLYAVNRGNNQIKKYIAAFKSRQTWVVRNKVTGLTETIRPAEYRVVTGAVERYRFFQ